MRRGLTLGEQAMARSVFGDAIDTGRIAIRRRKWFPLQPRDTVMAPCGDLHFHPGGAAYRADFSRADIDSRGLFVHELTHVWQTQRRGRFYLPLMRHPFCRYGYAIEPGRPLARYGLEQQAEIVRHGYMLREGFVLPGKPDRAVYERLLDELRQ